MFPCSCPFPSPCHENLCAGKEKWELPGTEKNGLSQIRADFLDLLSQVIALKEGRLCAERNFIAFLFFSRSVFFKLLFRTKFKLT